MFTVQWIQCSSAVFQIAKMLRAYIVRSQVYTQLNHLRMQLRKNFYHWIFPVISPYYVVILFNIHADNIISQCTSQLPAQITRHKIEDDLKEERETEFDDYIDGFVYGFCLRYTSHIITFFSTTGCRIIR